MDGAGRRRSSSSEKVSWSELRLRRRSDQRRSCVLESVMVGELIGGVVLGRSVESSSRTAEGGHISLRPLAHRDPAWRGIG